MTRPNKFIGAKPVVRRSFEAYWSQGWMGQHVVHRILPDGTISDLRDDLYDQAFGLLACVPGRADR